LANLHLLHFPEQIEFVKTSKVSESQKSAVIIDSQAFYGKPRYLSGQKYQYLIDDIPVEISLRYLIGTEANLFILIKELGNINLKEDELSQKIVRKDPIGFYAIFPYQNRLYLTACINPRGISTVTQEQFNDNTSDRALDREVIISWLLGQKDLRDRRCLWTLISTPIKAESDLKDTNQKLEKIWISWYEWWKPRFPQP
jgi:cyanosortase A-associated protein